MGALCSIQPICQKKYELSVGAGHGITGENVDEPRGLKGTALMVKVALFFSDLVQEAGPSPNIYRTRVPATSVDLRLCLHGCSPAQMSWHYSQSGTQGRPKILETLSRIRM